MNSILIGQKYQQMLDGWEISWGSSYSYRHWCTQCHSSNDNYALIVMLNPGSLSHSGENLSKDITLRILREVFQETGLNPFVVNLFDYSASTTEEFFSNWEKRDGEKLIYDSLSINDFKGVLYAYGDYENICEYQTTIKSRISFIKSRLSALPEIVLPKNMNGTPKHPIIWQRQKIKTEVKYIIKAFALKVA